MIFSIKPFATIAGKRDRKSVIVTDRDCIRGTQSGDINAFRDLFDKYRGLVYRIGLNIVGAREDAEDVLQEVFLRLYRGIRQVDAQKPLKPYICRIATNCALNLRRRRASTTRVEEAYRASHKEADDHGEKPGATTMGSALMNKIEAILPEQQGRTFSLKHFAGLTIKEIAEAEECAVGTVKATLHFATVKLRRAMRGDADGTD